MEEKCGNALTIGDLAACPMATLHRFVWERKIPSQKVWHHWPLHGEVIDHRLIKKLEGKP
jgi:hypothetical protein